MIRIVFLLAGILWMHTAMAQAQAQAHKKEVKGSGYILTQQRGTPAFSSIWISQELKAFIVKGEMEPITIEADDNLFPYIQTEVKDGILKIFIPDSIRIIKYAVMNVLISMPGIRQMKATTGAYIEGPSQPWPLKNVSLETSTAANIRLHTEADSITIQAGTDSQVELRGATRLLYADIHTGATLYAREMKATGATLNIATGAEAKIEVSGTLKYTVNTNGNLILRGNPTILKSSISTGGKLKHDK